MRCQDCPYHYREDHEVYPHCHFEGPEGWAPCEQEEVEDADDSE